MAGLKKPKKKDSTNPSTVLIIFLVFFVLLSLGLGVWGYYGYAGQTKLAEDTKKAINAEKAMALSEKFHRMMAYQLWIAGGYGPKLDATQIADQGVEYDDFRNGGGKYANEKMKDPLTKVFDELTKELGYDNATKTFKNTLVETNAKLKADLLAMEKKYADLQQKSKKNEEDYWNSLLTKLDEQQKKVNGTIAANAAANLNEARKRGADYAKATELANNLNAELQKVNTDKNAELEAKDRTIAGQKKKIDELLAEKAEGVETRRSGSGEYQPLVLDISSGRPLWDISVGHLSKVDLEKRIATIEVTAKEKLPPVKVGQTFNVFRRRADGRPEGFLRATVEVFKPLSDKSAQVRILSVYGKSRDRGEVQEIDLAHLATSGVEDYEIREGDLIYNMFWGSNVAIAGPASMDGAIDRTPAKQMEKLSDFVYFLKDRDIGVDAYVDLASGELKGEIHPRTRFLILTELNGEAKEDETNEVAKQAKEAIKALKAKAIEKGMLIISPQNFQFMIGYRRSQGMDTMRADLNRFVPRVAAVVEGSNSGRPAAPAKDAPAKDAPAKEPEAK